MCWSVSLCRFSTYVHILAFNFSCFFCHFHHFPHITTKVFISEHIHMFTHIHKRNINPQPFFHSAFLLFVSVYFFLSNDIFHCIMSSRTYLIIPKNNCSNRKPLFCLFPLSHCFLSFRIYSHIWIEVTFFFSQIAWIRLHSSRFR